MNEENKITIKLTKPIKALGKELTEVELREPSGKEISKLGIPFTVDGEGGIDFKSDRLGKYFDLLGNLPAGSHEQLKGSDFIAMSFKMQPFFMPSEVIETSE